MNKKILIIGLLFPLFIFSCNSEEKVDIENKEKKVENTEKSPEGQIELTEKDMKNIRLKTAMAQERELPEYLKTAGEIEENENFTTHVSSRLSGRVLVINYGVGESVKKGDVLAIIESKEVTALQSQILEALSKIANLEQEIINKKKMVNASLDQQKKMIDFYKQVYERQKKLFNEDIAPRKNVEEADKNLKSALIDKEKISLEGDSEQQRIRGEIKNYQIQIDQYSRELQIYNFSSEQIRQMIKSRSLNSKVSIFAPVSGLISQRHISLGEMVDSEKELLTIIKPSAIWVFANVYEKDIDKIKIGQKAYFVTRSNDNSHYNAVVNYIPPQVNHETRTAQVRLFLSNPTEKLRKGMYADVFINIGASGTVITVPKEAIQRDEKQQVVYLKKTESLYQKIAVVTGRSDNNFIEIKSGLKKGDNVVTKGSFTIKSISKKDEMGEE